MKLHVNTEDMRGAVLTVISALAVKTELNYTRAYEFIHVCAKESSITLKCCNLSIQIETAVAAHIENEGTVLLPGKLFADIVRMLPGEETLLERDGDAVRICSGSVDMRLQTIDDSEFAGMGVSNVDCLVRMNEGTLKKMVSQTAPLALQDSSRPILGGVLMEISGKSLSMVALDGLKLAKRTERIENEDGADMELIVSSKLLESAAKVLSSEEGRTITMHLAKQNVMFETEGIKIILRTMDGQFIRYKEMLPKAHDTGIRLNKRDFYLAIERAYLVARDDRNNLVRLTFEGNRLTVAVNNEVGYIRDEVDISMSGSGIVIAFNAKYLLDILKNIEDDEVCLEMTVKPGPCVIRPVEGEVFYYLILPVRLIG